MNDQGQKYAAVLSRNAERLYRAMTFAYALVACVDKRLTAAETRRFVDKVRSTPALQALPEASVIADFNTVATRFFNDYEAEHKIAIEHIAQIKDWPQERAIVIAAAQIAVVADRDLKPQEEAIIAEICRILGLDPDKF